MITTYDDFKKTLRKSAEESLLVNSDKRYTEQLEELLNKNHQQYEEWHTKAIREHRKQFKN